MRTILTCTLLGVFSMVWGQNTTLKGRIMSQGKPLQSVSVLLTGSNDFQKGTATNAKGEYELIVPVGSYHLQVSAVGMQTIKQALSLGEGLSEQHFSMEEDVLGLDQIVLSGTRVAVPSYNMPVVVSSISAKQYERLQAVSLSEGLRFSPGLRTETNCQNCGFNQLRINGLDGSYSQILINGRAVFSSLLGIYGLEMIPANMIERVEVVRGGGSALYGSSAIAGTLNVITKNPTDSSFALSHNLSIIGGNTPEHSTQASASVVSSDSRTGMNLFGFHRNRSKGFDANNDGFSEITQLKSTSFGTNLFWEVSPYTLLKFNFQTLGELRRGGNKFDLLPHESDITEQLKHTVIGADSSLEHYLDGALKKHKLSLYASAQHVERKSYYGGGLGRFISPTDDYAALTDEEKATYDAALRAYGASDGLTAIGGVQYHWGIAPAMELTLGSEYQHDMVDDRAHARHRSVLQKVNMLGSYAQLSIRPVQELSLLVGGRYDYIDIDGRYVFSGKEQISKQKMGKFVPRLTAMYSIGERWKLRTSYAQGYRAPQSFDEDLHTDVLAGDPIFVALSPNLRAETSHSFNASVGYTLRNERNTQISLLLEGFHTIIHDKFYDEELSTSPITGVLHRIKQNATDALRVYGINAEANLAIGSKWLWQNNLTLQRSLYDSPQALGDGEGNVTLSSKAVMRSPKIYGSTTLSFSPSKRWTASYAGIVTGSMLVPHTFAQEDNIIRIHKSNAFFEQNIKLSHNLFLPNNSSLETSIGVQNLFNSYQQDFDKGVDRDATYIYGPQRPRTFFISLSYKL